MLTPSSSERALLHPELARTPTPATHGAGARVHAVVRRLGGLLRSRPRSQAVAENKHVAANIDDNDDGGDDDDDDDDADDDAWLAELGKPSRVLTSSMQVDREPTTDDDDEPAAAPAAPPSSSSSSSAQSASASSTNTLTETADIDSQLDEEFDDGIMPLLDVSRAAVRVLQVENAPGATQGLSVARTFAFLLQNCPTLLSGVHVLRLLRCTVSFRDLQV